jgi:integrase
MVTPQRGWRDLPVWVFCTTKGTPLDVSNVEHAFKRALRAAKLLEHFSPHGLRHTFASLLLQQGESPAYVQRQLGHASIQLTVDTYGRWLPMGNKAAVDCLDDATPGTSGSKVVANPTFGGTDASELPELTGAGGGS